MVHTGVMRWSGLTELPVLSPTNMNPLTGDFFVYFGLLAWSHARDFVSWYRTRELEGARLTARIAGSRFQALRVQLRPQFLLATLDLLADLVHRDVPRAERLITRLADTLRLTLELGRDATTTLKQELDLLLACVETHRVGIRPGVQLVSSASSVDAGAPHPQSLAVHHGRRLARRRHAESWRAAHRTGGGGARGRCHARALVGGGAVGRSARVARTPGGAPRALPRRRSLDAGSLVSVTFPDRATAVLLIADPPNAANRPEPAGLSVAVA